MPNTWKLDYPDSSLALHDGWSRNGAWRKYAHDMHKHLRFNEPDSDHCVSQLLGVKTRLKRYTFMIYLQNQYTKFLNNNNHFCFNSKYNMLNMQRILNMFSYRKIQAFLMNFTISYSTSKCYISKKCANLITNIGQTGYSLTHQIFFLQIGEMVIHLCEIIGLYIKYYVTVFDDI